MTSMCDTLRENGGRPTAIFTDLGSRRAYLNLLTTQRRFTNTQTFEGGHKGVAFAYDDDIPYWEFAINRRNTQGLMTGITAG
jgi:hypothetical protein